MINIAAGEERQASDPGVLHRIIVTLNYFHYLTRYYTILDIHILIIFYVIDRTIKTIVKSPNTSSFVS